MCYFDKDNGKQQEAQFHGIDGYPLRNRMFRTNQEDEKTAPMLAHHVPNRTPFNMPAQVLLHYFQCFILSYRFIGILLSRRSLAGALNCFSSRSKQVSVESSSGLPSGDDPVVVAWSEDAVPVAVTESSLLGPLHRG
jgi:hypothetical protein